MNNHNYEIISISDSKWKWIKNYQWGLRQVVGMSRLLMMTNFNIIHWRKSWNFQRYQKYFIFQPKIKQHQNQNNPCNNTSPPLIPDPKNHHKTHPSPDTPAGPPQLKNGHPPRHDTYILSAGAPATTLRGHFGRWQIEFGLGLSAYSTGHPVQRTRTRIRFGGRKRFPSAASATFQCCRGDDEGELLAWTLHLVVAEELPDVKFAMRG